MVAPPVGLVYRLAGRIYQVGPAGTVRLPQADDLPQNGIPSPDQQYVLLTESQRQTLVDRQGGEKLPVWPRQGYNLCPFSWVPGQPALLLTVLLPGDADPGFSCNRGSPVLLDAHTGNMQILDAAGSGLSAASVSPDGRTLAYDLAGVPWLLEFGLAPQPFDLQRFTPLPLPAASLADPAWSPSGRYMAWTFSAPGGSDHQGLSVFDLEALSAQPLVPYPVAAFEGLRPHIGFSPDEKFLVLRHYLPDEGTWASQILSLQVQFSRRLDGFFGAWNPQGSLFWLETNPGQAACQLNVESPDGSLRFPVCYGNWAIWSPDGALLLTHTYNRDLFWLTELPDGETLPVDLPPGAEIVSWEAGG
jgi:hypothetical protein